jgi:hypothetical protein
VERQRNNYQKHKTHQSSPPNTFIKPKRKDSIKFTDNNNSQKYDKSNVLKSVTTTNKNNTNEVVNGNEKQRRRKQEKNMVGIPQMVSNQRKDCVIRTPRNCSQMISSHHFMFFLKLKSHLVHRPILMISWDLTE